MRITRKILDNQINTANKLLSDLEYKTRLTYEKSIGFTLYLTDIERQESGLVIRSIGYGGITEVSGKVGSMIDLLYVLKDEKI